MIIGSERGNSGSLGQTVIGQGPSGGDQGLPEPASHGSLRRGKRLSYLLDYGVMSKAGTVEGEF